MWFPLKLSKIISKNHLVKKKQIEKKPKKLINNPNKKYWKYKTIPNKKIKIAQEVEKGQGLFGTIWNGVFCNLTNNISLGFNCLFKNLIFFISILFFGIIFEYINKKDY